MTIKNFFFAISHTSCATGSGKFKISMLNKSNKIYRRCVRLTLGKQKVEVEVKRDCCCKELVILGRGLGGFIYWLARANASRIGAD